MTFMKIENSLQSKNISQIQKIFANPEKIFALSKLKLSIKKTFSLLLMSWVAPFEQQSIMQVHSTVFSKIPILNKTLWLNKHVFLSVPMSLCRPWND